MATDPVLVQALTSFTGEAGGVVFRVTEGYLFEPDSPAVKKWPELFGPVTLHYPVKRAAPRIEQATAAPGEKRGK